MKLNNWPANIQDWLLPRLCPGCHGWTGAGRRLCIACEKQLPRVVSACPRCAQPYDHPNTRGVCGTCQRRPPPFAAAHCAFRYAPPVDHFIRALKFNNDLGLAALLGAELARAVRGTQHPDLIVPVPLHASRLRRRGYNQALEIARAIAHELKIPIDAYGLVRRRATDAQSDLPLAARRRNVRGAFQARSRHRYRGLHIALVDDVMTSGSTAEAAARALRAGGAKKVEVWIVARA